MTSTWVFWHWPKWPEWDPDTWVLHRRNKGVGDEVVPLEGWDCFKSREAAECWLNTEHPGLRFTPRDAEDPPHILGKYS